MTTINIKKTFKQIIQNTRSMIHTSLPTDICPTQTCARYLFLSSCLLGGLGDLSSLLSLLDALDNTNCDGLTHVTDGKTSKRRVVRESLNAHRLRWNHLYDCGITRLDEFR